MTLSRYADARPAAARRLRHGVIAAAVGAAVLCAAAAGAPISASHGGAAGATTVKIVADLPLSGDDRSQTTQMVRAIRFVLSQAGYKAGGYRIQFEAHDDATASSGEWSERLCALNARTYAADPTIVGVIGTFNSGCSAIEIPILNRAPLAMVSPGNTYPGLTKHVVGTDPNEPSVYYPGGGRNYTRVVASDDNEGRIGALYMKRTLHVKKVFVLNDRSDYGRMTASVFEEAAKELGLEVVGHDGWERASKSYSELMTRIKATGADGVYLGGDLERNGARLLRDKVAVLGGNTKVKVVVADGFIYPELFRAAGAGTVEGIVGMTPVAPPERLVGEAGRFVRAFGRTEGRERIHAWTIYAAAAAQVLLDAIARSDGTRTDVLAKLFATDGARTVLGPMSFDGNGDPRWATEAVYKAKGGRWIYVGSPSYESQVKPGRVADGSKNMRVKPAGRAAHEAWFAPNLPKSDRFTGTSMRHTRLSEAAYELSKVMGAPMTVNVACWSTLDWPRVAEDDDIYSTYGVWLVDMPHWLHLSPRVCRAMETLLHNRPRFPNVYTADAVATVTHEMMHALGTDDEAQAECFGMQLSPILARNLGVPAHYALRLAHLNLENYAKLPREYIDRTHCREDGVWDLREDTPSPPWHAA